MKMYHFMSRLGNSSSYVSVFLQLSFLKKIFFLCWHNAVDACTLDETAGLRYSLILADMKLGAVLSTFWPKLSKNISSCPQVVFHFNQKDNSALWSMHFACTYAHFMKGICPFSVIYSTKPVNNILSYKISLTITNKCDYFIGIFSTPI